MSEVRRKYDSELKKNAVKLSYASTKSVAEVARELGISDGMLYRWRQKYTADGKKQGIQLSKKRTSRCG